MSLRHLVPKYQQPTQTRRRTGGAPAPTPADGRLCYAGAANQEVLKGMSDLPATAEVVVVGAGCIGASTAVQLAQAGVQLPIEHQVHDVGVFRQPPGFGRPRHLAVYDLLTTLYYRPEGEGYT